MLSASGHNRNRTSSGITARIRDRTVAQGLAAQQAIISNPQTTTASNSRISEARAGSITTYTPVLGIGYAVEAGGIANQLPLQPIPPPFIEPPLTVPGAPIYIAALNINGTMVVSFIQSSITGGTEVLDYMVTASPGGITQAGTPGGFIFNGLTGGQTYTFTVVAYNTIGQSEPSEPSAPTLYLTTPSVPQVVLADIIGLSTGDIRITWVHPATDGGQAIQTYTIYIATTNTDLGNAPITVAYPATSAIFTVASPGGLAETYRFYVVATNSIGNSPQSYNTNAIQPHP